MNKLKVLIVDDEGEIVDLVSDGLSQLGCETYEAFSVGQCFEKMVERVYDVIITDLNMPVQNGMIIMKRVQNQKLPTQVYLLSASELTNPKHAKENGFRGLFRKPFDVKKIYSVISEKQEHYED